MGQGSVMGGAAAGQEGGGPGGMLDEAAGRVADYAEWAEGALQAGADAGALVAVGETSGSGDDVVRLGREAAAARTRTAAAVEQALVVARASGTAQGHAGYGAVLTGSEQGVGAGAGGSGLAGLRTRPRDGEASPAREPGQSAGRGARGSETGDRKANRVSKDPRQAMTAELDGLGDGDDMQEEGPSQQLALMLGDMGM